MDTSFNSPPGQSGLAGIGSALWYWGPVVGYAVLIFTLSSLSGSEMPFSLFPIPYNDKILHALVYGGLALLALRAFRHAAGLIGARYALVLAVVVAALYGMSDELHQVFVPNRHADVWDWVADTAGATLAIWIWKFWWPTRRRLPEPDRPVPGISDPAG
ncbi:MAG: VanZ family protein [Nitrospirae bacterium]|nr:VanZ family protein [Nitrospirota bacterium]